MADVNFKGRKQYCRYPIEMPQDIENGMFGESAAMNLWENAANEGHNRRHECAHSKE
jgi:hypothetical protein